MLELAPNRKQGLTLANPIMAASGSVGVAHEASDLIALDKFGAIVTSAISLHGRRGSTPSRALALRGGMMLHRDAPSLGWSRVVAQFGSTWARSKAALIVHLVGNTSLPELARRAEGTRGIAGIEIDVEDESALARLIAVRSACALPILARLCQTNAITLALLAVEAGADVLVCIAPPRGAARDWQSGQVIEGELFGPLVKPFALKVVCDVAATTHAPVVACGGVHSNEDVNEFLAAGASAVMIDSVAWIDPGVVNTILDVPT